MRYISFILFSFVMLLSLCAPPVHAQQEAASATEMRQVKPPAGHTPKMLPRRIPSHSMHFGKMLTKRIHAFQERQLHRRSDRDKAINFFLITLGAAVLIWGLYFLIYFMTLDVVSGGLLSLLGPLTILAILASLALLMGIAVLIVGLAGGRY